MDPEGRWAYILDTTMAGGVSSRVSLDSRPVVLNLFRATDPFKNLMKAIDPLPLYNALYLLRFDCLVYDIHKALLNFEINSKTKLMLIFI